MKPFSQKMKLNNTEYWIQLTYEDRPPKTVAKISADNLDSANSALDVICKDFVLSHNVGNVFLYSILEVPKMYLNTYNYSDN